MPFSYAQYAGNGSATTFSVPFPYLLKGHVKLYTGYDLVAGTFTSQLVDGVDFTWTSGTQVQTTVAPAAGVTLTIIRDTPDSSQLVTWNDGSNLVAADQNTADLQNLYVVQEQQDRNDAVAAQQAAATQAANSALAASTAAVSTANATSAAATGAVATANAASVTAAGAVATANAASVTAAGAVATANAASVTAAGAAVTANAASSSASAAVATAVNADVKSDAAIAAIANSINYTGVANVAAIPPSPGNNDYVEILDATGLENFSPLTGLPGGFIGDSGLRARLRYTTTGNTWSWIDYAPTNPDARYVNDSAVSSSVSSSSVATVASSAAVKTANDNAAAALAAAAVAQGVADAALPKSGGTMFGAINFANGQQFPGTVTGINGSAPVNVTAGATPTISVNAATASAPGVVQLSDSTISNNSSVAASSAAVKSVNDFVLAVSATANNATFAAGTVMLFQQTSAPTGWTKITTHDNKALRVVSGSTGSGGATAFTSVFASRTPAGAVSGSVSGYTYGGGVQGHTLSWNEMPVHNHGHRVGSGNGSSTIPAMRTLASGVSDSGDANNIQNSGGNWAHAHGFSPPAWAGSFSGSFSGSAMDFNVQYVDVIFASKN